MRLQANHWGALEMSRIEERDQSLDADCPLKGHNLGEATPFGSGMLEEGLSCKASLASSPTSGKIDTSVL